MASIIKYDPWRTLGTMNQILDDVFQKGNFPQMDDSFFGDWKPAVDLKEDENRFLITADLPGVNKEDIDIDWENNILTIKGKRENQHQEKGNHYSRVERTFGSFMRSFALPQTADAEKISAQQRNGVLVIEIPKQTQALPKKIQVDIKD